MMETNSVRNLMIVGKPVVGNIPTIAVNGGIKDSGFRIDDSNANSRTLWSSAKISEFVIDQIPKDPNVAKLLNDTAVSTNSTWSSQQIQEFVLDLDEDQMERVPTAVNNNVAVFLRGGVADSGFNIDDSKTSSAQILWSSKKIDEELLKLVDDMKLIDDTTASKTTSWSSEKSEETYLKRFRAVTDVNAPQTFPVIGRDGTLQDSSVSINNLAPASDTVLWTSLRSLKSSVLLDYVANQTLTATQPVTPAVTVTFDDISQWNGQGFLRVRRKARFLAAFRFFCTNPMSSVNQFVSVVITRRNQGNANIKSYQFSYPQTNLFMCHGSEVINLDVNDELLLVIIATEAASLNDGTCTFHEL